MFFIIYLKRTNFREYKFSQIWRILGKFAKLNTREIFCVIQFAKFDTRETNFKNSKFNRVFLFFFIFIFYFFLLRDIKEEYKVDY